MRRFYLSLEHGGNGVVTGELGSCLPMFETVLKKLLARYLGQYVDVSGISAAKLKAAVWSGEIVLQNLALKHEALAWLELPVHIRAGNIGLLQMSIPWASLY